MVERDTGHLIFSKQWGCSGGAIKSITGEEEPVPKDPKVLVTAYLNNTVT